MSGSEDDAMAADAGGDATSGGKRRRKADDEGAQSSAAAVQWAESLTGLGCRRGVPAEHSQVDAARAGPAAGCHEEARRPVSALPACK
ncbi:unnamed protein product [Phytophthora fragariaefolia]|uniref:Unnamed protein product n=1 Tax=Phytophthora fragariaefolia TaxID=1490495 RepID=A0A9W6XSY8_9STRA|nr:unnamed protein product [Phytophthora fragariaefolia]